MQLSIITINYNNKEGLEKTINSVVNQKIKNFEYIVIDGGSSDGSIEAIKKKTEYIHYWKSEKDNGIYDAINKGIIQSSSDYLIFLNSGDYFTDNDVTAIFCEHVKLFPETDIFYGDIIGTNNRFEKTGVGIHKHPPVLELSFLKENNINHQSSFIKSTLFKEFGLYPEKYKLASDHWLYVKSFVAEKVYNHINYPLVTFDFSGVSSLQRSLYEQEMQLIWKILVPKYVQLLVNDQNIYKTQNVKKIYKVASWIDHKIQKAMKIYFVIKFKVFKKF